jgi:DNA-binding HxlR family transcriptional regulator
MSKKTSKRSPCPVACALDLLGDKWTLLVVRDLWFGRTRFKDFMASPEGIPTNILSDRLERLVQHGVVDRVPAKDGTKRLGYELTEKGKALELVLKSLRDWSLAWDANAEALMGISEK